MSPGLVAPERRRRSARPDLRESASRRARCAPRASRRRSPHGSRPRSGRARRDSGTPSGSTFAIRVSNPSHARCRSRCARSPAATRRARNGSWRPYDDEAVAASYAAQVATRVARVRHTLRWLNAMSVEASPRSGARPRRAALRRATRRRAPLSWRRRGAGGRSGASPQPMRIAFGVWRGPLDYGTSFDQLAQIRVPELHARGLTGAGVVVALFDAGFPNLEHEAFATMRIVAERDFVQGLDTCGKAAMATARRRSRLPAATCPASSSGPPSARPSCLPSPKTREAKRRSRRTTGPRPLNGPRASASTSSARRLPTASSTSRIPATPTATWTAQRRSRPSRGTMAAARGVVVVNSAGNAGFNPARNTLVAPADGLHVVSAGAVDRAGLRAPFSSVGPTADGRIKPDVAALGVAVKVATLTTVGSYGFASGTSFSLPAHDRRGGAACSKPIPPTRSMTCCWRCARPRARRPRPTTCSGGASSMPSPRWTWCCPPSAPRSQRDRRSLTAALRVYSPVTGRSSPNTGGSSVPV